MDIKPMQMEKPNPSLNTGWEVGCDHFIVAFGGQRAAGWGMLPLQGFFSCSYIREQTTSGCASPRAVSPEADSAAA